MLWTFGIKFSLTVETTVFNSQQLFPSWGIMQERVYNMGKIANVEELRQRIVDEWVCLDQRIIDSAVKEWRKRLRACAAAEGGQFEHELTPDATVLLQLCIMTLPFNRLTAYNIFRDCFQCSLTLSVTCSRCETL